MALVRLTSCESAFQAELVKGQLADLGIDSVLQGANFNQTYGPIAAAEVVVLVDELDYEKAAQILPPVEPNEPEPERKREPLTIRRFCVQFLCFFIPYFPIFAGGDYLFGEVKSFYEYLFGGIVFSTLMTFFSWYVSKWTKK